MIEQSQQVKSTRPEPSKELVEFYNLAQRAPDLFKDEGTLCGQVMKAIRKEPAASRVQRVQDFDLLEQPFSFPGATLFRQFNAHHGACLDILPTLTLGAGFHSGFKIEDALDPLCGSGSFLDELVSAIDNRYELGQGYLEIVREDPSDSRSEIQGVHWLQAEKMFRLEAPAMEDGRRKMHLRGFAESPETAFASTLSAGSLSTIPTSVGPIHAPFGFAKEFIREHDLDAEHVSQMSEVIDFRVRCTRNTAYGIPRWLSATTGLELMQAGIQHEFDYFYNRGMPHWLLFLNGAKISNEVWLKMLAEMQQHVGEGNSFKGAMFNIEEEGLKPEMFQLGSSETTKSRYVENSDEMAMHVVTAHGVPPKLASVVLPGRIGATNEMVMEIWAFQVTRLFHEQRHISKVLARTLGNPDCGGRQLGLSKEDFLGPNERRGNGFVTVMEDENLEALQGTSRMKDPLATTDRDPALGVRRNGQDKAQPRG